MREKIYFLAKGNFTYEAPKPVISPEKVEIEVVAGMKAETTFTISNSRHTKMKGFGFCDVQEITFLPIFEGEENVLTVEVDATELIAGTNIAGKLLLVTDCGELKVPYEINVIAPVLTDDEGRKVSDYFTLMKRTEKDPKEGLKLFKDPRFKETFLYRDPEGRLVYDRLMKGNTGLSGMEEFLVAFDKKEPVRFMLEHSENMEYELSGSDIEDVIMVNLNAWGSTAIRVDVSGDFIEADRKILWTDEFIDMRGRLDFKIVAGRVPAGNHVGAIRFTSPYESHEVEIVVHSPVGAKDRKISRAKQAVELLLLRSLLAFEEGRVTKDEFKVFLQKHRSVLERLTFSFSTPLKGYMAWILSSEASKLEFYRDTENEQAPGFGEDQSVIERFLLNKYVKFLYSERDEDREELSRLVSTYAENGYLSEVLLVLGLRCDTEKYASAFNRVERIRKFLIKGSASPILYSELIKCYRGEPQLLTELDALNLRALLYGLRQGLITEEMADVITVLSEGRGLPLIDSGQGFGYTRENDPLGKGTGALLMNLLYGIYELYPNDDTLKNICALLIRYEKRDKRFFSWYEKGVSKMLRITDLFEYYVYTVDPNSYEPLPANILSYFQYENHLNDARKAYLYANIVKNRQINPVAYSTYEEQIREFVRDQIEKERISTDLGYLYTEMLTKEDVIGTAPEDGQESDLAEKSDLAKHLPHIMFRHLLTCMTPDIESVTLVYLNTLDEKTYPLDRGKALLDIYTPEFRLFFSDTEGNQYVDSIDYTLEYFYDGSEFAPLCYPLVEIAEKPDEEKFKVKAVEDEPEDPEPGEQMIMENLPVFEEVPPPPKTALEVLEEIKKSGKSPKVEEEELPEEKKPMEVYDLYPIDVPESLIFHLAARIEKKPRLDVTEADVLFHALATGKLRETFHGRIFLRIYDYIREQVKEHDKNTYLRLLMRYLDPNTIKRNRIGEVASDCIRCGEMAKASQMLKRYGRNGCKDDEMAKLVVERIREIGYEFDDCLVKWAYALYEKGHHERPILNYLLQYYMGETDTLISLFRDSMPKDRSGTGTMQIENSEGYIKNNPAFYENVRERLLGQVLFAGRDTADTEDVFLEYFEDGENRMLVKAYLSQVAYEYVVGRGELSEEIFEKIYRQAMFEKEPVMVLAALKSLVDKKEYDENETGFIMSSLEDMAARGCILPFMKDFAPKITVPFEIRTPVLVQYYSGTPDGVFLFVKNKNSEYESKPMDKVFDGIFTSSVLLFAGEETVGYIYEEETGKRSKQFELRKKDIKSGGASLFEQVNAMLEARRDGDEEKYNELSEAFATELEMSKELFTIL